MSDKKTFTEKENEKRGIKTPKMEPQSSGKKNTSEDKIEKMHAEFEALKIENDKLKISLAKCINDQKMAEKNVDNARFQTAKSIIKDLSEIVDVFFMAIDSVEQDKIKENTDLKNLFMGVDSTRKSMLKLFEKLNVSRIEPKGEKFNSSFHQALAEVESEEEPGIIITVVKPGYIMNDSIITPALVTVSKNKSE